MTFPSINSERSAVAIFCRLARDPNQTVEARNIKFGKQNDEDFLRNKIKIRSKGVVKGTHDLLL